MCWWSHTKPPERSPLPIDLSPLACHLARNSRFLRALPLLSGKEAVTPALGIFYLEVCLFTVWVRQSWIGGSCRQNIRLKLHPKPLLLKLPQQLIPVGNADNHLSCCSRSFLPLWLYKPTTAVPKCVYVLSASYKPVLLSPHWKVQQLSKPWTNRNHFKTLQYHHAVPPSTAQRDAEGREK